MALPVTVRAPLYNSANSQATTRAETYVSPYIRAGWENWKLALAEAKANAEAEDSAYKARLAYYKILMEAKSELQKQLASLQEESYKNGANVDKENFSAEAKFAIEDADAQNQARRTAAEEAGKNNRAELGARTSVYGADLRLAGDREIANAQPSKLTENADDIRGAIVGGYDPSNPTAMREAVREFKQKAMKRGDQIEDVRKGMDALVRSLEAATPAKLRGPAIGNLMADTTLADDLLLGQRGNKKGVISTPPPPDTNVSNSSYRAVSVDRPAPLVAKPADTSDLEAKLAALDAKLRAIDVSEPERKSLIEEARSIYAKNFRGFPGAIKAPTPKPTTDRLQATKIEAAKKAKQLFDAHSLDISDPVNVKERDRVFGSLDSGMQKMIDDLVNMRTSKTEPGVIEKQIQSQYEGTPQLADAMAYYIFKSKTTRVPTPVVAPEIKGVLPAQ